MAEGGDDGADFTAAELASVGGRRSYNRAISLAFSQEGKEESSRDQQDIHQDELKKTSEGSVEEELGNAETEGDDSEDVDVKTKDKSKGVKDLEIKGGVSSEGNITGVQDTFDIHCGAIGSRGRRGKTKRRHLHKQNIRLDRKQYLSSLAKQIGTTPGEAETINVDVVRPVPTLVELCLRKGIKRVGLSEGPHTSRIAPGIRSLLKAHQNHSNLEQIQLKWLLEVLKQAEQQAKCNTLKFMDKRGRKKELLVRDCRSLFSTDEDSRGEARDSHRKNKFSASLVLPCCGFDSSDWAVAALAHCIDLLLPLQLPEVGAKKTQTIIGIKRLLSRHSSELVNLCFDTSLAYVWWSRGEVDKAKELLLASCESIPSHDEVRVHPKSEEIFRSRTLLDRQRALYHNEIGRLLSQFDQPVLAGRFYRSAVDEISEGSFVVIDKLVLQSLALSASAYDQGLMDHEQAVKAATLWKLVTSSPGSKSELVQASVDSLLHCHAGSPVGETEAFLDNAEQLNGLWLLEANSRIAELAVKSPQMYLYQSLILSMLGEPRRAEQAYEVYVQQSWSFDYESATGTLPTSLFEDAKAKPWWILFEWCHAEAAMSASKTRKPINALPLLWRRMLKHPYFNWDVYCFSVCEMQGKSMNLHLTHDGFLSGAMMQNLPPWRSLLLDPHTGRICLQDQHRQHEIQEWENYPPMHTQNFTHDFFIPMPILLYQDASENTAVSLLNVNSTVNFRQDFFYFYSDTYTLPNANVSSTLIYSKGGQTVRLNLRQLVMEARQKSIQQQVKDITPAVSEDVEQDVQDLLDFCITRGLQIDFPLVKEVIDGKRAALMELVRRKLSSKRSRGRSTDLKTGSKKKLKDTQLPPHQSLQIQEVLFVGTSTVVLCLYTAATPFDPEWGDPCDQDTLVFLDCSSAETFSNPVINCPDSSDLVWMLPRSKSCWKNNLFKQNVLYVYAACFTPYHDNASYMHKLKALVVFDESGKVIHKEPIQQRQGTFTHVYTACSGWHIVGLDSRKTSLRSLDTKSSTKLSVPTVRVEDFEVVADMVFVSRSSRVCVLHPGSFEPFRVVRRPPGKASVSNTDGVVLHGESHRLDILSTDTFLKRSTEGGCELVLHTRVILGVLNHVLILERENCSQDPDQRYLHHVEVVADIRIPGMPEEAHFISKHAGLVVAASVFEYPSDPYYRASLYWFSMEGVIKAIHPILGPPPYCFKAIPISKPEGAGLSDGKMGGESDTHVKTRRWHLFFADGLGALCCIKLDFDDPSLFH
ncbi:uncharacterized protein LOC119725636 [Patiria miniata]|uniref:Uncharacterized protein n=1 Tax=Patiria miniata TaxID=46514 RepID=A0A913ZMK7_PATMI|nr:uncharacterized protein LOC119725636 [Patiria miniata]